VWLRREITLPADFKADNLFVQYGRIWALSEMYINGIKVGSNGYNKNNNRFYLKPNVLVAGKNIFVIRVMYADTSYVFQPGSGNMVIESKSIEHPFEMSIAGPWECTTTLTDNEIKGLTNKTESAPSNTMVTSIFNFKMSPLIKLPIKGFLWYQGENDASVGYFYRGLFKNMITDWREQFGQGNLPFIFAQLPAYGTVKNEPVESRSEWPDLRESQADALSLPKTAMAVILELGTPDNIHPHNKKPVGNRMANAAMKMVYDFKNAPQSPLFKSYTIVGNEVHIHFTNVGTGLSVRDDSLLKGFAIAGADKAFVWADAKIIRKDEIVVSAQSIKEPASVRYAWANSPVEANLVNKEGLPAAPFRTDDWKLFTEGKINNKN
jgi:sialate O-acetylesterase